MARTRIKPFLESLSKRTKSLVAAVTILAVIYCSILYFGRKESLLSAGTRLMNCAVDLDASCMMEYMRSEEKAATGVSESSLQQFLDEIFWPALEGMQPVDEMGVVAVEDQMILNVNQAYTDGKGRTLYLSFSVTVSDQGPVCVLMLRKLYLATLTADWVSPPDYPSGLARTEFMLEALSRRMASLQALDLRGIANPLNKSGSELEFKTWSELADRLRAASAEPDS